VTTTLTLPVHGPSTGFELIATDRPQLEAAHARMIEWAQQQIARCRAEQKEEKDAFTIAKAQGWAHERFRRRVAAFDQRITFYEKIEQALRAGYVIVPNLQMTVFAIRTEAKTPRGNARSGRYNTFTQSPQLLAAGDGRYVDPNPFVHTEESTRLAEKGGVVTEITQWPTGLDDEIPFPIALAKPELMERTAEAMGRLLFDEIGVAEDTWNGGTGKPDPIILGRLRNPRRNAPAISFFIGWYFDPSRL
jgi:hypothetical protein